MAEAHVSRIAADLSIPEGHVQATVRLLDEGSTVPFIARYRKEATGGIDEVAVAEVRDRLAQLRELERRRSSILKALSQRGQLTEDLLARILEAPSLSVLEDIYLPFRPKRRTRAIVAKERGLEPLAELIFRQEDIDPIAEAAKFVDKEKGISSPEDALSGARDIIAEGINEDTDARAKMRQLFMSRGVIRSSSIKGKEAEGSKYRDYFDWSEPLDRMPSHRILALLRGSKEGALSLHLAPPEKDALLVLERLFVFGSGPASLQVRLAAIDSYKRLLAPSMETEILGCAKDQADREAISVFAENLRQLLLAPAAGSVNVLAVDPGFRTGCKLAVLDVQGGLVHSETIYPNPPQSRSQEAAETVMELCERFGVQLIAVGNGTAGRETEEFLRRLKHPWAIPVVMVSEAGASIYSASEAAREEFPDQDATVRGAVSIGRRLMDPLAELVKIDPKAIGVGQYQHDVDQKALKDKLDDVVTSCVSLVGVDLNTASKQILAYVAGLGPALAKRIVEYREAHGLFRSRDALKLVPRLGPKAFEQAAGFLRVKGGENPLDSSGIHPERYPLVEAMAGDLGVTARELMENQDLLKRIDLQRYVTAEVGLPTLEDILSELSRPGRDPRQEFEPFSFAEGVETMEDLLPGLVLPGIVTNITAFGAFVDIGVHQDGLVHKSQLSDRFVHSPADVVKVGQRVTVTVMDVDLERRRISLSMKTRPNE